MMTYLEITEIEWDTDGDDPKELGLPEKIMIEDPPQDMLDDASGAENNDSITDWLSDHFGYCVFGCRAHARQEPAEAV